MTISIEAAKETDLPAILTLLEQNSLPQDGLAEHIATTLIARNGQRLVGSVALELYGTEALFRSLCVANQLQGQRIGQQLMKEALKLARQHRVTQVYLLTETASEYFPRFGFRPIPRSAVPSTMVVPKVKTVFG